MQAAVTPGDGDDLRAEVQRVAGVSARNRVKVLRMVQHSASHQAVQPPDLFSSDEN